MALSSHMGGIIFADPANIRKGYEELMTQVRTEAIHISNKYRIQIEPIQFEWDRILATLEKDFPGIWDEMLSCNSQPKQPLNSNVNRSIPNKK